MARAARRGVGGAGVGDAGGRAYSEGPRGDGRALVNSRSEPAPPLRKSASCAFLSSKVFFMTVIMSTLKKKGAWPSESPAPMDVTTEMRLTPLALHASMMFAVPSRSIVAPTSEVLPPSATTTPVMPLPSKTAWGARRAGGGEGGGEVAVRRWRCGGEAPAIAAAPAATAGGPP